MIQTELFWFVLFGSVVLYWLLPSRMRLGFLAVASSSYLATVDLFGCISAILLSGAVFGIGHVLQTGAADDDARSLVRRGRIAILTVLGLLAFLLYFKVLPLIAAAFVSNGNFLIPLGVSYFTFKMIHYIVESSRGNIVGATPQQFFAYMMLFPVFSAGPIDRFDSFMAKRSDTPSLSDTAIGLRRIIFGLAKMFIVGSMIILPLFGSTRNAGNLLGKLEALPVYKVWGFLVLDYLYAYVDFSAYSDIAIGASRLFGFRIVENFRYPIFAPNISDFWKRWHISLVNWCQSYVYMPIFGLTRSVYRAIFGTFFVIALWHALSFNWVAWGLWHAGGIVVFHRFSTWQRKKFGVQKTAGWLRYAVGMCITFAFVTVSGVFVSTDGIGGMRGAFRILAKLVGIDV